MDDTENATLMATEQQDGELTDTLPKTCSVVSKTEEAEVYVVGTAHFSRESQEDVALVSSEMVFYL